MALTRKFSETVVSRAARDCAFRLALLQEAVQALFDGDVAAGCSALRDYINATIGFEALADATGAPITSIRRMFSPSANPTATDLFAVINALQSKTGVRLEVRAVISAR